MLKQRQLLALFCIIPLILSLILPISYASEIQIYQQTGIVSDYVPLPPGLEPEPEPEINIEENTDKNISEQTDDNINENTNDNIIVYSNNNTNNTGVFQLILPNSPDDKFIVEMSLFFYNKNNDNIIEYGTATHEVSFDNGVTSTQHSFISQWISVPQSNGTTSYQYAGTMGTFSDISGGTTITLPSLSTYGECNPNASLPYWEDYDGVYVGVSVFSTTQAKVVDCSPSARIEVEDTHTIESPAIIVATLSGTALSDNDTSKTFTDVIGTDYYGNNIKGEYDFLYYLNNYNAISLNGEIEATHIVGPIIATEHAARAGYSQELNFAPDTPEETLAATGYLSVSDYSRGVPSYIGLLVADPGVLVDTGTGHLTTILSTGVKLYYAFDISDSSNGYGLGFDHPALYAQKTGLGVLTLSQYNQDIEYVIPEGSSSSFISPNHAGILNKSGAGILQNDNFINKSSLLSPVITELANLEKNGVISSESSRTPTVLTGADVTTIGTYPSVLSIEYGKSYIIGNGVDTISLDAINFVTGDFQYGTDIDMTPTTIVFANNALKKQSLGGNLHTIFPLILIDGVEMATPPSGYGGEYNDTWNKIIWALPYTTGFLAFNGSINIPGHLIAPLADIRHYYEDSDGDLRWAGGNINGCMIANSIQSGAMEFHMWAYGDAVPVSQSFSLEGVKNLSEGFEEATGLSYEDFTIQMNFTRGSSSGSVTGVSFPMQSTPNKSTGKFAFSLDDMVFSSAGDYFFTIEEVQSTNATVNDDIIINYDVSQYTIKITVNESLTIESVTMSESDIKFTNDWVEQEDLVTVVLDCIKLFKDNSGNHISQESISFEFIITEDSNDALKAVIFGNIVESSANGGFSFEVYFTATGDYTFYIREIIPDFGSPMNVSYDSSVYKVEITVTEDNFYGVTSPIITITKISDNEGNTENESCDSVIFTNILNSTEFPETGSVAMKYVYLIGTTFMVVSIGLFIKYYRRKDIIL